MIRVAATLKTRSRRTETIKISAVSSVHIQEGRSELDSHADMCVAGATWKVKEYTGVVCNVYPYSNSYKPLKQVPVVEAVTAYNHPTGETFILVLAQALYLGDKQEPSLLCPNQMRSNRIVVDDVPKHLSVNCALTHSIYILSMDLRIPLEMDGVISYINTWYPNESEVENCTHISLTGSSVWEPHSESFAEQEAIITNSSGVIHPGKSNRTIFALN